MPIHSLFIGINYSNSRYALNSAVNDANTLHELFCFNYAGGIQRKLVEANATVENIRQNLKELAEVCREANDVLIVHFSGHGARVPAPCLVTYGWHEGAPTANQCYLLKELSEWVNTFQGGRLIVTLDACYTGGIANARATDMDQISGAGSFKARAIPNDGKGSPESTHTFFASSVGQGNGKIIVAAASENEVAYEENSHGVFTRFLIDALSGNGVEPDADGLMGFTAIFDYVSEQVTQYVGSRDKDKAQNPVAYSTFHRQIYLPSLVQHSLRSLMEFPKNFKPLTVVVGDRRERTVLTAGDVLALDASPADLTWILSLGLDKDTEIITDKVFVNLSQEHLVRRFGNRNLLCIGSPASNHLSRILNEYAIFWFDIGLFPRQRAKKVLAEIRQKNGDPHEIYEYLRKNGLKDELEALTGRFKRNGFVDPTFSLLKRVMDRPRHRDFGIVSLCPNPYSQDKSKIAILAGGAGLPGTMHAVKLLADPTDNFRTCPAGGIFEVTIPSNTNDWLDRLGSATAKWITKRYTLTSLEASLEVISKDDLLLKDLQLEQAEILAKVEFLRSLMHNSEAEMQAQPIAVLN